MQKTSFAVDASTRAIIDSKAERLGVSRSALLRMAVRAFNADDIVRTARARKRKRAVAE